MKHIHVHLHDASTPADINTGIKMIADDLRGIGPIGPAPNDARIRQVENHLRRAKQDIDGVLVSLGALDR